MANNKSPRPDKQDNNTVLGMTLLMVSPNSDPTTRIIASTKHHTSAIPMANS